MNMKTKVHSLEHQFYLKHICPYLWLWRTLGLALKQALPISSPLKIPPFQEAQRLFTSSLYGHEIRRKSEYGELSPSGDSPLYRQTEQSAQFSAHVMIFPFLPGVSQSLVHLWSMRDHCDGFFQRWVLQNGLNNLSLLFLLPSRLFFKMLPAL